jgi:hypothetical protein
MKLSNEESKNFILYGNVPMALLGLIFNFLLIVVFSRKSFGSNKVAFYWKLNALSHTLNLGYFLVIYAYTLEGVDLTIMSEFMCKVFPFFFCSSIQISSWIELLATYDRKNSVQSASSPKRKNAAGVLKIVAGFLVAILLLNTPNLAFYLEIRAQNSSLIQGSINYSLPVCTSKPTWRYTRDFLSELIRFYVPFVVMLFLNIALFRDLKESSNRKQRLLANQGQSRASVPKEIQYGLILFVLNIFYFVTHVPIAVVVIHVD